jgi:hypothetical protein
VQDLPTRAAFWNALSDVVVARRDNVGGLCIHGLGPLTADALERRGAHVDPVLAKHLRVARIAMLTAVPLLERVRDSCDGPMVLLKGPEAALRYPNSTRGFGDIDLLVPDAFRTQDELLAAGFVQDDDPAGIWVGIHHLARVRWPGSPLPIEVHTVPKWPDGLEPPSNAELLEAAVPSATAVEGLLAPCPTHHALLLAAHAWAHQPIGRARDLVDVGAFAVDADPRELEHLAHEWGLERIWATMAACIAGLGEQRPTWPLRLWARHVWQLRDQTVMEAQLERLLAPFWGYEFMTASQMSASALSRMLRPAHDETWREKAVRMATASRRPFASLGEHRRSLGHSATRGRRPAPETRE